MRENRTYGLMRESWFITCSLLYPFQVAVLNEIKQWIISLGPEAYVIEPEKLKTMVKSGLKKALIQYEGTMPEYSRPQIRESKVDYIG